MSKVGKLNFYDLEIETILWVYDFEKVKKTFLIDLEVEFYLNNSYYSDKISDTIDTWMIKNLIRDYVFDKNYNLLEAIGYDIVQLLIWVENILNVKVTVYKEAYTNIRRVGFSYHEKTPV